MICERCDGQGEREIQIGGNGYGVADVPVVCTDCRGTGVHHTECDRCGERFRGSEEQGDRCPCSAPKRRDPDDINEDLLKKENWS